MRDRFVAFLVEHRDAFERACVPGHVTASAWIVDAGRTRALLTHHRKLGKWLQLGGHVDGDRDVRRSALREATEESGLRSLRFVDGTMYDIDVHLIPARGAEPAHEHFDVRFALEADAAEPLVASDESHELAWVPLDVLVDYGADESVLRLARKTAGLVGYSAAVRGRFEFNLYPITAEDAACGSVDKTLALLGAQGWEIRAMTTLPVGSVLLALQRPLDEETPLPDATTLSATLSEPLTAPAPDDGRDR